MAGLAADTDFRPCRREAITGCIIVLAHAGRMTLAAHEVPVLVKPCPMQDVVVADGLVGIEMEPALAALAFGTCVPGEGQGLHAAIGKLNEILLKGIDAEGVFHFEGGEFAVSAVGFDEKLSVVAKEARTAPVVVEGRIGEITKHGLLRCMIHRMLVLRGMPKLRFGLMTAG